MVAWILRVAAILTVCNNERFRRDSLIYWNAIDRIQNNANAASHLFRSRLLFGNTRQLLRHNRLDKEYQTIRYGGADQTSVFIFSKIGLYSVCQLRVSINRFVFFLYSANLAG